MEIQIKDLNKNYFSEGKTITALSNVNLTIPPNKIFTLLGPSGCGKTTLLRCIVGLEMPDSGEIRIGEEIVWSKDREIFIPPERRGLSMVFQTYAIWPHMDVFDNVAFPLQVRNEPKEEIRKKVEKTLRFVQLEGFENRPATKLSGGQQQRVALARALAPEPKVILFDEPLSNLDAKLREETRKELRSFLSKLKITAVYVTHDRIEALSLSDTIAVMKDGRIMEIGTPKEIYFDSEQQFVVDFVGRTNLIEGTIVSIENDGPRIKTPIGEMACQKQMAPPIGSPVMVSVRPEFITVKIEKEEKGRNTFRGKVESLVFIGEAYEGEMRVGETRLITKIAPTFNLKEGDEVALQIDPKGCTLIRQ
ncbi:MAG: ABC transporter ATP-binding protein [Syntrophaceae bacterium]|nr:ABC transporter ATP-binding protein [Syntrophaceae bacterium]